MILIDNDKCRTIIFQLKNKTWRQGFIRNWKLEQCLNTVYNGWDQHFYEFTVLNNVKNKLIVYTQYKQYAYILQPIKITLTHSDSKMNTT